MEDSEKNTTGRTPEAMITRFQNVFCKHYDLLIEAKEWIDDIRNGKYKTTVEGLRDAISSGNKTQADTLKHCLPCVVFAGDCRRGRHMDKFNSRTGWAMFDFDHLSQEQIDNARVFLTAFPCVAAIHVTCSGEGLRVVVNLGLVHTAVYRQAYEQVALWLKSVTGMDPDMQCRDFARVSLASYDPFAYFNPHPAVFAYPEEQNPMNYVPPTGPDPSEDFRSNTCKPAAPEAPGSDTPADGPYIRAVVERFFSKNAYTEGTRHQTLLRLGGYLRWRGVKREQLEWAVSTACSHAEEPGMTRKEVSEAIKWGYDHGSEAKPGQPFTNILSLLTSNGQISDSGAVSSEYAVKTYSDKREEGGGVEDEEEFIETTLNTLPDDLFYRLPPELTELLAIARDKRERDVTLLSCITVLSAMFPALRTMYGNQKYSPHIYACFLAPAGAGKSVATYSTLLAKPVHRAFEQYYFGEKAVYDNKTFEWEMELRHALTEKRKPDLSLRPEEPVRQMFLLQANTSKSQLLHDMAKAADDGAVLFTSEIDSLADALRTDYGKHAAELRMFFHHEKVGLRFKTDKEPVEIETPRLALAMSGTPEQLVRFIRTLEDGMYSRFLFYMMGASPQWMSQSPLDGNGGIDVRELFDPLAQKLKENFFATRGQKTMVSFTPEQWNKHEELLSAELGKNTAEGHSNTAAIVFRAGLIAMRIAMTLCGLRIMHDGWTTGEYICFDDDFDTAMDIVLTALRHSAYISTMINETQVRRRMTQYYRFLTVLEKMPERFRFSDFAEEVARLGKSQVAAARALKKYVESGLLTPLAPGYLKTPRLKHGVIG